jgi:hypothetical protein
VLRDIEEENDYYKEHLVLLASSAYDLAIVGLKGRWYRRLVIIGCIFRSALVSLFVVREVIESQVVCDARRRNLRDCECVRCLMDNGIG